VECRNASACRRYDAGPRRQRARTPPAGRTTECSGPPSSRPDRRAHSCALGLMRDGKHAEAAQAYAGLATLQPAEHDNYELLSAEQWLAAGNIAAAKQAFAAVSAEARTRLPT